MAALLLFAFALYHALTTDHQRDFFIFRLGAELAARGENPYDVPRVRAGIEQQYPNEPEFVANSGYFLPPAATLLFMPFAMLPWGAAKVAWAVANGLAAYFVARLPLMLRDKDSPPPPFLLWSLAPFILLLNPLAPAVIFVGQFTVVFVGCVAGGLLLIERGKPYLAAALWVVPFVKPHLALPLIPLLWFLAGWRPAALLLVLVGVLNLAGAWLAGGSPLFLKDYFEYLPTARAVVAFNRVELNPTITSWNRLLYASGGPLIELTAVGIFAGYLVWFGLLLGRCAATNTTPTAAWVAAAAAVGGVLCAQVLVYELLFLAVAVPWVRELFAGSPPDRIRGWLAVTLMASELIPQKVVAKFGLEMHNSLAVSLLAVLVLIGPAFSGRPGGAARGPVGSAA